MKRPFIRLLLAFVTASVLFGIIALIFGASIFDVFFKITDGWIFGILFMAAFDLYSKLTKHPEKVTPVYIVTLVSVLLSACMFCMAGMATDVRICIIGISLAGLFGVVSAISILVPFVKERKEMALKLQEFSPETYQKGWAIVRERILKMSDSAKKQDLLENFLLFHVVNDDIYNNVNLESPLFTIAGKDGTEKLVPVSKAKEAGVSDVDIEKAKAYIAGLIG